jgi:hypothetical protein
LEQYLNKGLNLAILVVPILLVILSRLYLPNRFWVGMAVSILAFPIGHFYLKGGLSYTFIILLNVVLLGLLIESEITIIIVGCFLSALFMAFRLHNKSLKNMSLGS